MPAAVQLVCMPFQMVSTSSLSLALLAAYLRQHGVQVGEHYLHLDFAALLGLDRYQALADGGTRLGLLGEVAFAEQYHGEIADPELRSQLGERFGDRGERDRLFRRFRQDSLARVAAPPGQIIGFTTSFNQLMPSVWLAREITRASPDVCVVLGGSACSEPMGAHLAAAYPHVSVVVSGSGEKPLLDLARGQLSPGRDRVVAGAEEVALDDLPFPDYSGFLDQYRRRLGERGTKLLAFEASRGCWFHEVRPCAFCGLNGPQSRYRMKSAARVLEEIDFLWKTYGQNLAATDNILANAHLRDVMPRLAERQSKPGLFLEVKANLRAKDVTLLRRANVGAIQPGIESLSTRLLQLMRKGVTALQNVALLKWCREHGIKVCWNLLCGIPGESAADYYSQVDLIHHIHHLHPPQGVSRVRVDRYSVYFENFQQHGWKAIEPLKEYRHLHQVVPAESVRGLAYHFDGIGGSFDAEGYFTTLRDAAEEWKQRHQAGDGLFWSDSLGLFRVSGGEAFAFDRAEALELAIRRSHEIVPVESLRTAGVPAVTIEELVRQGVLMHERGRVVNVAVRLPD